MGLCFSALEYVYGGDLTPGGVVIKALKLQPKWRRIQSSFTDKTSIWWVFVIFRHGRKKIQYGLPIDDNVGITRWWIFMFSLGTASRKHENPPTRDPNVIINGQPILDSLFLSPPLAVILPRGRVSPLTESKKCSIN